MIKIAELFTRLITVRLVPRLTMHMLVIPQITLHNHYVTADQHVRKTTDRHQPCEHLLPKLDLTGLKNQHQYNLAEDSSSLSEQKRLPQLAERL